jgi:hypothetical protein
MANIVNSRPFDNFRTAITDPEHFVGRSELLGSVLGNSRHIHILLGGRRIGKTSALRAIEWHMLDANGLSDRRAFPVFVSLDVEQPRDLDNFRYILLRRLRDAIERWTEAVGSTLRVIYRSYLSQVATAEVSIGSMLRLSITNPDAERKLGHDDFREALVKTIARVSDLGFDGVLFLLDEADYVVRTPWANDAWSYIRGLKDADMAVRPFLGVILSGYRYLKEYEQRVGSPLLNIAEVKWLSNLSHAESTALVALRNAREAHETTESDCSLMFELSGGHPFVLQQAANAALNNDGKPMGKALQLHIRRTAEIDGAFSSWWNEHGKSDGFGEAERSIYLALRRLRKASVDNLARVCQISVHSCFDALDVLCGTGVARRHEDDQYEIAGRLFEDWTHALTVSLES